MRYHFTLTERISDFLIRKNLLRYSVPLIEYCDDGSGGGDFFQKKTLRCSGTERFSPTTHKISPNISNSSSVFIGFATCPFIPAS